MCRPAGALSFFFLTPGFTRGYPPPRKRATAARFGDRGVVAPVHTPVRATAARSGDPGAGAWGICWAIGV